MEVDFFGRVYEVARQIPQGKVTTYGLIAGAIGSPRAARMVGWAMNNADKAPYYIPAHRVLNRNGMLTGKHHFPNENTMQELLESEGFVIVDNQVQNFEGNVWKPAVWEEE